MTTTSTAKVTLRTSAYDANVRFGYGAHAAYVVVKHERGGYKLIVREHVTTSTVVHSIGQPDLWADYNDTLAQTRLVIADIEAATIAEGWVSHRAIDIGRRVTSARIMAECAAINAEYVAMLAARG